MSQIHLFFSPRDLRFEVLAVLVLSCCTYYTENLITVGCWFCTLLAALPKSTSSFRKIFLRGKLKAWMVFQMQAKITLKYREKFQHVSQTLLLVVFPRNSVWFWAFANVRGKFESKMVVQLLVRISPNTERPFSLPQHSPCNSERYKTHYCFLHKMKGGRFEALIILMTG